jgi:hypothetical protein
MSSPLQLAGAFDRLAGVVLGAFTNCEPDEGYGTLTLDEVFDDYFKPLNVPVYSGAAIGHIKRKFTLPIGLEVEMDADVGTIRFLPGRWGDVAARASPALSAEIRVTHIERTTSEDGAFWRG